MAGGVGGRNGGTVGDEGARIFSEKELETGIQHLLRNSQQAQFTFHMCRRGGAFVLFSLGKTVPEIADFGFWDSLQTARKYATPDHPMPFVKSWDLPFPPNSGVVCSFAWRRVSTVYPAALFPSQEGFDLGGGGVQARKGRIVQDSRPFPQSLPPMIPPPLPPPFHRPSRQGPQSLRGMDPRSPPLFPPTLLAQHHPLFRQSREPPLCRRLGVPRTLESPKSNRYVISSPIPVPPSRSRSQQSLASHPGGEHRVASRPGSSTNPKSQAEGTQKGGGGGGGCPSGS